METDCRRESVTCPPEIQQWVFVGGYHRSGTTALRDALAACPGVTTIRGCPKFQDEGQHLQDVLPVDQHFPHPWSLWGLQRSAYLDEASPLNRTENAIRLRRCWGRYHDRRSPIVVEKTPRNMAQALLLQALFPDAAFVMIRRDPKEVASSFIRCGWPGGAAADRIESACVAAWENFESIRHGLKRCVVVDNAELRSDPKATVARIWRELGIVG